MGRTDYRPEWYRCRDGSAIAVRVREILENELTLEGAVSVALLNNRELQSVLEQLGIASAELAQAGLLKNPILSLAYRFSTQPAAAGALIDISLLQNFIDTLLIPLKKKRAAAELEATKARVTASVLDLIREVKTSYYAYQARRQLWDLREQFLLAAESSYEVARHLMAAGNIKEVDLAQRQAAYEQAKIEVADAEIQALAAQELLRRLLGLWGSQEMQITIIGLSPCPPYEGDWQDVVGRALECSLDLAQAYYHLRATAAKFGVDTTNVVFPTSELGPAAEREEGIWYVGPAVTLPLPIFDTGKAMTAAAQSEIYRQWNHYTALAINIRSQARIARLQLLNAFRQSRYYREVIVPLMEEVTQLTLRQYNAMQVGVFQLLSAKQAELESKIREVEVLLECWIAKTEMELLMSGHLRDKEMGWK
ncbi:MAG: TolC family protein [Candidatus Obscuribacterales bacterium]